MGKCWRHLCRLYLVRKQRYKSCALNQAMVKDVLLRTYIYSAKKQEGNIKHLKILNFKLHCEYDLAIFWWAGLSDPRTQHEVTEWDEDVTCRHLAQPQFLPDRDHLLRSSGPGPGHRWCRAQEAGEERRVSPQKVPSEGS